MTDDNKHIIRDLGSLVRRAEIVVEESKGVLREAEDTLRGAMAKAVNIPREDLELGGWKCKDSPTGKCFYNMSKDPPLDFCLICGGPDERQ